MLAVNGFRSRQTLETVWLPALAIICAAGASLLMRSGYPEMIPVHWDLRARADSTGGPGLLLAAIPVVMVLHWATALASGRVTNETSRKPRIANEVVWVPMLLALPLHFMILNLARGWRPDGMTLTMGSVGILLFIAGIMMPFSHRNSLFGIRTPATFATEAAWKQAHVAAGPIVAVGGILVLSLLPFFQYEAVILPTLAATAATVVVSGVVSHMAARRAVRDQPIANS